jgi:hypothetical protein
MAVVYQEDGDAINIYRVVPANAGTAVEALPFAA